MRKLILISMFVGLNACMPKIEDEVGIDAPVVEGYNIEKVASTDSDIVVQGKCPANASRLIIAAENSSWTEALKAWSTGVRQSGEFAGECKNGKFSFRYAVPNPTEGRKIKFKIRVANSEGRQGDAIDYTVNYKRPSANLAGFAIVSVGGVFNDIGSGGQYAIVSGGQVVSGLNPTTDNLLVGSASGASLRLGLLGVLLEP